MSGYASVFRKAASGEANLVFRNIVRLLSVRGLLNSLEELLEDVLKMPVTFQVNYDSDRDLYVEVLLATGVKPEPRDFLPVDLWGTGILQVTQIFAYVLLFRPALLLIDEPDSHLHPSRQKSLGVTLEKVAEQFKCKILVSTHSRHLITGASDAVKVIWMKDGRVESDENKELTALLLDLGALDQLDSSPRFIICTEDEKPWALKLALDALGYSADDVKLASFNGLNNSSTAEAFREMADLMKSSPRVVIHRDRDFLNESELSIWSRVYTERSIGVFCPPLCDTESYHTSPEHIAKVTGLSIARSTALRNETVAENEPVFRKRLVDKRRDANRKFWQDGGGPKTDELWPAGQPAPDSMLYGKSLLTMLDQKLKAAKVIGRKDSLADHVSDKLTELLKELLLEPRDGLESHHESTSVEG